MVKPAPRIGLALGGGGARGLAHIAVLEAFDELGVKPAYISGTSIGALIGAPYAAGMSAAEIRSYCGNLLRRRSALVRHFYGRWRGRFLDYWKPNGPSPFSASHIFELILPADLPDVFEGLSIPLEVVATDFYKQTEYVMSTGALLPALAASSALPGLLKPVEADGRVLIDGGFVNPLPFDLLRGRADYVIAVDVSGGPSEAKGNLPRAIEAALGAQQIALRSIINAKLRASAPDMLIRPNVGQFRVLDFLRKDEILNASEGAKADAKKAISAIIAS